jgi:hypothetical protein
MPRLFHFSDDSAIEVFEPRPVAVPSNRPPGQEWQNGPLVWTISDWYQPAYLFPRDCPRILMWPTPETTPDDHKRWMGGSDCRMAAHVEWSWLDRIRSSVIYRYELDPSGFEAVETDQWMWVSREPQTPIGRTEFADLLGALRDVDVELRFMPSLAPLRNAWDSTMHVSGIRLRNASGWGG